MKITIGVEGKTYQATRPEQSGHVEAAMKCLFCGAEPLRAKGVGSNIVKGRDYYLNDNAVTLCCNKPIDFIKSEFDTIFGLEEDEQVLNGPWRVY